MSMNRMQVSAGVVSRSAQRISRRRRIARAAALLVVSATFAAVTAARADAQAANYPSLQLPTASTRDYTAAIAGGGGTFAVFQWREGAGKGLHLGVDAGVADYDGSDGISLFVGGSLGQELLRASADQPLDVLLTAGAGVGFGSGPTVFRLPVGVSVGHTFPLDGPMSITPYVHPRLSLDVCTDCAGRGRSRSQVSLNFDLGANFQVNRQFALRAAGSFSGSDFYGSDSFAVGFNWTPASLGGGGR